MKTLLILRHAKSSWKAEGLSDHDRPLNGRGKRDAPRMGRLIEQQGIVPDVILSSTARRARRTAKLVAVACDFDGHLELDEALYLAGPGTIVGVLRELPETCHTATVVGHNPGLEDLLDTLTGCGEIMPTATLARVQLPIENWAQLTLDVQARLLDLWRPRELEE